MHVAANIFCFELIHARQECLLSSPASIIAIALRLSRTLKGKRAPTVSERDLYTRLCVIRFKAREHANVGISLITARRFRAL